MPPSSPEELCSWKEIAAYLGVGVRTAQMWERDRGLPVRRLPGPRGRVALRIADLESWRQTAGAPPAANDSAPATPPRQPLWLAAALAGLLCLILLGFFSWPGRSPSTWRVDEHNLMVFDDQGRELWRKSFPALDAPWHQGGRNGWIGDLDGDGKAEVLFAPFTGQPGAVVGPLICYDHRGRERWRFTPGHAVRTGSERFLPPFSVYSVAAGRFGQHTRIVVSAGHYLYYPAQVSILDNNGALLREYWHAGHLAHILIAPVQGTTQILLGGINNATRQATLLVLNPNAPSGALNETNEQYRLLDTPLVAPTARLLFPRSSLNEQLEPFSQVDALWQEPAGITVKVAHTRSIPSGADIYYHLNDNFTTRSVGIASNFENLYHRLYAAHRLDHDLGPADVARLNSVTHLERAQNMARQITRTERPQ